jgi:hypothetical protein
MTMSLVLLLGGPCLHVGAGTPPLLEFDVPFLISCRSLPLKDAARDDLGKELIEVVIPISARVQAGTEKDLKQCLYTLVDPAEPETLSVTDWLPRTELRSEFAKPIQFSNEHLAKVGISLSAHYVLSAAGDATGQLKSGVAYELLPPQEIVLASGTVQHGHGVFFKLKPSTQTTLEEKKSFSAIVAVPRGWRGGCLKLQCEALGWDRGVVPTFDREVGSGKVVFYLALYLAGDEEAEKLAAHMATCQQELFDSLAQYRQEMRAACHKTFPWPRRLGAWPWFFDQGSSPQEALPTPAEMALLNSVPSRATTQARPTQEFPPQVHEKLRALHEAVGALQVLATGSPLARDQTEAWTGRATSAWHATQAALPAETAPQPGTLVTGGARASLGSMDLDITGGQPVPTKLGPAKDSSAPPGEEQDQATPMAVAGRRRELPGDSKDQTAEESAGPSLSPRGDGNVKLLESAGDGHGVRTGKPLVPEEPTSPGQRPLQDFPRQAWYLLASLWGALFTAIVAPLVVAFIRSRMKNGRRRWSRGAAAPLPPPANRLHRVALPATRPTLLLVGRHPDQQGAGSVAKPGDDQGVAPPD